MSWYDDTHRHDDQVVVDRFAVANAEFWLSMIATWMAEPGHADRFCADVWGNQRFCGEPVELIVAGAADRLRDAISAARPADRGRAW